MSVGEWGAGEGGDLLSANSVAEKYVYDVPWRGWKHVALIAQDNVGLEHIG